MAFFVPGIAWHEAVYSLICNRSASKISLRFQCKNEMVNGLVWLGKKDLTLLVGGNGWKVSMTSSTSGSGKREARIGVNFVGLHMLRGGRAFCRRNW